MADKSQVGTGSSAHSRVVIRVKAGNPAKGEMDFPSELEELRPQIGTFTYPIANHDDLIKMIIPGHKYFFRGRVVEPAKSIPHIPDTFFPIKSVDDFNTKLSAKIKARAARPFNSPLPVLKHPTSASSPKAAKKA
jgi:hypothetical protein